MSENKNQKENAENNNEDEIKIDDIGSDGFSEDAPTMITDSLFLQEELEKHKTDYLYLRAEFDNFKRKSIQERSELLKYGGERLAYDLLTVLDLMEKALETEVSEANFNAFLEGIKLTAKELQNTLSKNGINEIDCVGKKFDPNHSEALSQAPSGDAEDETVLEIMRKGYKYHDKVLRPSQVVVAKSSKES